MKIGISTASYFSRLHTEETFAEIAKAGADTCEVFLATHSEYTQAFADTLKAALVSDGGATNLAVHSVHALTNQFEPELFSKGDRAKKDAFAIFKNVCNVGQNLGAKYYTFHGATLLKKAVKYTFDYPSLGEKVNDICDVASEYGIKLCYENVHWAYFSTPQYFAQLENFCPSLGGVLDIKQAMQSKIDYREFLDVLKGRLCTVHVCDYDNDGNLTIPGKGNFDFVDMFKRLLDIGFDGACLLEVYSQNYGDVAEVAESYQYLKHCFEIANK
ncbi:MAG: sugar phosphate isomerase/epimerase [Clostridia bacterium]